MRKTIISVVMMLFAASMLFAQSSEKTNVCVEQFTYNTNIGTNWVEHLRNCIIEGLTQQSRLNMIDIKTFGELPSAENDRFAKLSEGGVEIVVKGHFTSLDVKSVTKDGKVTYETEINYTLKVVDAQSGQITATQNFKHSGSAETKEKSITDSFTLSADDMSRFVNQNFKITGIVKTLDQVDNKKGAKTLYITAGSNAGVESGQPFEVFQEVEVAGEMISKKIGEIKVKDVLSGTLSLCNVSKGGKEIQKAFESGVKLTVVSRAQKFDPSNPFGMLGL